MFLLAFSVTLLILGLVALNAIPSQHSSQVIVLSLAALGLFWTTALFLPPVASSVAAGLGVSLIVFARSTRVQQLDILPIISGLTLAVLAFHLTIGFLDLLMSTSKFNSATALFLATLERSVSIASLSPTAVLLAFVVGGAFVGRLLGAYYLSLQSRGS